VDVGCSRTVTPTSTLSDGTTSWANAGDKQRTIKAYETKARIQNGDRMTPSLFTYL
jgi:hypothetical protein